METMNKKLIRKRFEKSILTYNENANIQKDMGTEVIKTLLTHYPNMNYERVLELGTGTGLYTHKIISQLQIKKLCCNDLSNDYLEGLQELFSANKKIQFDFINCDFENTDNLPAMNNLITSNAAIQWLENPAIFFTSLPKLLAPKGIIAFSTFGPGNLKEIKELTGHHLNYCSTSKLGNFLKPYFNIKHIAEKQIWLNFASPLEVLKHLKQTGVTGIKKMHWNKSSLLTFEKSYRDKFSTEMVAEIKHQVSLTYNPITIIAELK